MSRHLLAMLLAFPTVLLAQDLVGDELQKALRDDAAGFWVYDDLPAAEKQAAKSGKPLLITFRCVP